MPTTKTKHLLGVKFQYCDIVKIQLLSEEGATLKSFLWLISCSGLFSEARFLHKTISQTFTLLSANESELLQAITTALAPIPKLICRVRHWLIRKQRLSVGSGPQCLCCWPSQGAGFSWLLLCAVSKHRDKCMERRTPGLATDSATSSQQAGCGGSYEKFRQEDYYEFMAIVGYRVRACLNQNKPKKPQLPPPTAKVLPPSEYIPSVGDFLIVPGEDTRPRQTLIHSHTTSARWSGFLGRIRV